MVHLECKKYTELRMEVKFGTVTSRICDSCGTQLLAYYQP